MYSFKRFLHTFSSLVAGAWVGDLRTNGFKVTLSSFFGILSILILIITLDWKKTLDEKTLDATHNDMDLRLLEQELKKTEMQEQIRKIKEGNL